MFAFYVLRWGYVFGARMWHGLLRMMKHHARLVIFLRDLRTKIAIEFFYSCSVPRSNACDSGGGTSIRLFSCCFHAKHQKRL